MGDSLIEETQTVRREMFAHNLKVGYTFTERSTFFHYKKELNSSIHPKLNFSIYIDIYNKIMRNFLLK